MIEASAMPRPDWCPDGTCAPLFGGKPDPVAPYPPFLCGGELPVLKGRRPRRATDSAVRVCMLGPQKMVASVGMNALEVSWFASIMQQLERYTRGNGAG